MCLSVSRHNECCFHCIRELRSLQPHPIVGYMQRTEEQATDTTVEVNGVQYSKDWVFTIRHSGHEYEVIWGQPENAAHKLFVFKNGEHVVRAVDVNSAKYAAIEFRLNELRAEYDIEDFEPLDDFADLAVELDTELGDIEDTLPPLNSTFLTSVKDTLVELIHRAEAGDFLGQYDDGVFYQSIATEILRVPEATVQQALAELIIEQRAGLIGSILVPYSVFLEQLPE